MTNIPLSFHSQKSKDGFLTASTSLNNIIFASNAAIKLVEAKRIQGKNLILQYLIDIMVENKLRMKGSELILV